MAHPDARVPKLAQYRIRVTTSPKFAASLYKHKACKGDARYLADDLAYHRRVL